MDFYRFIRRHIPGMRILPVSTEKYIPGSILDGKKLIRLGHCREVLYEEPESSWEYTKSEASIIYGCITAQRKLGNRISVMGVFSAAGNLNRDISVSLEVSDIRGATLRLSQLALQPRLNELRSIDRRGRWRQINNHLVVLETFYANCFKARFYRDNHLLSQSALEQLTSLHFTVESDYNWVSDHELVIANNHTVPFGVRGFLV